jgi:hypothetical protein
MKLFKIIPFLSIVFGLSSLLVLWTVDQNLAICATKEDGFVETLSALFYLVGIIVSFITALKTKPRYLAVIWMLLCTIFLGEETSWFQRYLGYSVQSVENLNAQKEFNLHNLIVFQGGKLADSSSEFSIKMLLKGQNLFRLGFFGYFLVIPVMTNFPAIKRILDFAGYEKPSGHFTLGILVVFFISFALAFLAPSPEIKSALAETREMLYAFFIMIYITVYLLCKSVYQNSTFPNTIMK